MRTHVTVDKAGRVVLPKPLRDRLRLSSGDTLELDCAEESITLRPIRQTMPLQKERGVWVYRTGRALDAATVENFIAELREERSRDILR